jgi:uncharacterized membrane protein YGL010W
MRKECGRAEQLWPQVLIDARSLLLLLLLLLIFYLWPPFSLSFCVVVVVGCWLLVRRFDHRHTTFVKVEVIVAVVAL